MKVFIQVWHEIDRSLYVKGIIEVDSIKGAIVSAQDTAYWEYSRMSPLYDITEFHYQIYKIKDGIDKTWMELTDSLNTMFLEDFIEGYCESDPIEGQAE